MRIRKEEGLTFDDVLIVPKECKVGSRSEVDVSTRLTKQIKLDIPIVSAPMASVTGYTMAIAMARAGGIGIIHRFMSPTEQSALVDKVIGSGFKVGAAIGVNEEQFERLCLLNVSVVVIDIAHGHSARVIDTAKSIRELCPNSQIIAGNVATAEAVHDLGPYVDAIKVGIGPGSACTTRTVSGAGVPQLTAIDECARAASSYDIPIIADGGIRTSGDIVKALAAGASSVMIGNLLAATSESPAKLLGSDYREYYGSASSVRDNKNVEGVKGKLRYRGYTKDMLDQLVRGIRSGISYAGAKDIKGLQSIAEFIKISPASLTEGHPHDLLSIH